MCANPFYSNNKVISCSQRQKVLCFSGGYVNSCVVLLLFTTKIHNGFSLPSALKHTSIRAQNKTKCLPLVEILPHLFLLRRRALSTLTACRAGSRLNFVSTKSFSQEAHAKRFMGRSSARGELLNFLQTASFWREKSCFSAACLHANSVRELRNVS